MGRRGIPTTHAGTRFRSRLEARWAAFFDAIGWRWEYEPFDLDGYVPDFAILGARPFLVEVKPALTCDELLVVAKGLERHKRELLVVGASPRIPRRGEWQQTREWHRTCAGVLLQRCGPDDESAAEYWAEEAWWARCRGDEVYDEDAFGVITRYSTGCDGIAVWHTQGAFIGYPCSHYDGGGGPGPDPGAPLDHAWAEARNRTQWQP